MSYEESIYNLLPKEQFQSPKGKLYKSKFDPTIPPTGSTFAHHTTGNKVTNLGGNYVSVSGGHSKSAEGATFGKLRSPKSESKEFMKKQTGSLTKSFLPAINSVTSPKKSNEFKKPAIPKLDDKPIMGLVSSKNYILANKVENMLMQPKVVEEPVEWTKKKNYGVVPKYLDKIKEQTQREYEHVKALQQMEQEQDQEKYLLNEEELQNLREGLKNKWEVVNKEYQLLTHKTILDTIGLRRRKETCEKELAALEKDLDKLHKGFIFVDTRH